MCAILASAFEDPKIDQEKTLDIYGYQKIRCSPSMSCVQQLKIFGAVSNSTHAKLEGGSQHSWILYVLMVYVLLFLAHSVAVPFGIQLIT
jgi:hypothetical protein